MGYLQGVLARQSKNNDVARLERRVCTSRRKGKGIRTKKGDDLITTLSHWAVSREEWQGLKYKGQGYF
jgi:hypothetical protein